MSDFTPVVLVKGDQEFVADSPTALVNALYGRGYTRKSEPVELAAVEETAETPAAETKATSRTRNTTSKAKAASAPTKGSASEPADESKETE